MRLPAPIVAALLLASTAAAQLCGDCDGSGAITITDSLFAAQAAAGTRTLAAVEALHCNVQGLVAPDPAASVDILDALALAQAAAGLPVTLVCGSAFTLETTALCDGEVDAAFWQRLVTTGGVPAITPLVTAGALPPGVGLTIDGMGGVVLEGNPTTAGPSSFTVELQDAAGAQVTGTFTVDILPPEPPLHVATRCLPLGIVGEPYDALVHGARGADVGFSSSLLAGALPAGLTLDGAVVPPSWGAFLEVGTVDLGGAPRLTEISGLAASRRNPGILWVHDDSGATASITAIDRGGNVRQRYDLAVSAVDWEDLALGPGPLAASEYLYIGDVGDNGASRSRVWVLRVEEPIVPAMPGAPIALGHEEFHCVYPGGARDCETLLVDWPNETVYLLEKQSPGTGEVYRFPGPMSSAWTAMTPVTLVNVPHGGGLPPQLTAGDATRDGQRVVLRNYFGIAELVRPSGGTFADLFLQTPTGVAFPFFQQYEAIAYTPEGNGLVTVSELMGAPSVPIYESIATRNALAGRIIGTPTTPGTQTFDLEVTEGSGATATRTLAIEVR